MGKVKAYAAWAEEMDDLQGCELSQAEMEFLSPLPKLKTPKRDYHDEMAEHWRQLDMWEGEHNG